MTALGTGLLRLTAVGLVCGALLVVGGSSAQKEILRFGCACLMVILLLSIVRQTELPVLDTLWYEKQVQQQVDEAQEASRQAQLEQVELSLKQELERQAAAIGLNCRLEVTCDVGEGGVVVIRQTVVHFISGPREKLEALRQSMMVQLAISLDQIIVQEETVP